MVMPEVCTTQQAAKILGISVTTVQQLVEAGVIEAWKTRGGHRRIPFAAVQAYKAIPAATPRPARKNGPPLILVVEDNELQRVIYERQLREWNLQAQVQFCENGYQAMIEIAARKPDILLADIAMDGIDGDEVIRTILKRPEMRDMDVALLSGLTPQQIAARGGIPAGVPLFPKPINFDELRGYLRACCARHFRDRASYP